MFAIGHFAIGYLTGKGTSKLAHININLPLLLVASILPDIDLLFFRFMNHRGLTHSIIILTIIMIPFFVTYKKQALPYFAALLSHVFIGDLFTGGAAFLWPITRVQIGLFNYEVNNLAIAVIELILFLVVTPLMFKLKDLQVLLKPRNRNLYLIIAFGSVLGPLALLGRSGAPISNLLIIPSLFWLILFGYSMYIDLRFKFSTNKNLSLYKKGILKRGEG